MSSTLPARTYLYFGAQSINLTTAVMSVSMAAIVGAALAPTSSLATVPYGVQFLLLMLATYPVSRLMQRIGRKRAFMLGAVPLAISGLSGFWAVEHQHFGALILSHGALGVYIAFANFNRFAATDDLEPALKPRALSLVVAGGVLAAVAGPALTELCRDVAGHSMFSLCYAAFIGLASLSLLIALCLPSSPPAAAVATQRASQATQRLPASILLAMAVAAAGYGIMNLLMIQASMHMGHLHEDFSAIRLAIQWHVIAMFAPSFFTGAIIARLGIKRTLCAGLALLASCAVLNIVTQGYLMLSASLIVLGLGWNLTYVGAGALLAQASQGRADAFQLQGRNDLAIAICAMLGAFAPAMLLEGVGWVGSNVLCALLAVALLVAVPVGLADSEKRSRGPAA